MSGRIPIAQIKLFCRLDLGDEWDWVILAYRRKIYGIERQKQLARRERKLKKIEEEKLREKEEKRRALMLSPDYKIRFPAILIVQAISLYDLLNVHQIGSNSPFVMIESGSVSFSTQVIDDII
jgi:hypothetical protein